MLYYPEKMGIYIFVNAPPGVSAYLKHALYNEEKMELDK